MNSNSENPNQTLTDSSDIQKDGSNNSLNNQSNDKKCDKQSMVRPKPKEESVKYKTISSRYMQSAKQWANKRTEDNNQTLNTSEGTSSRLPSRNESPEDKKTMDKKILRSTPLSTVSNESLNVSGISVINKINENKCNPLKPEIKKYSKPLRGRKSLAPKSIHFNMDQINGISLPMTSGFEMVTKNKDFEDSIKRSLALQTLYLNLKAKQSRNDRKANTLIQISNIWRQTNVMRDQLKETQIYVHSLDKKIQMIEDLKTQKSLLEKYSEIRSKVDPLFNELSLLIANQTKLFKIENCSEDDFNKIGELLRIDFNSERMETIEKIANNLNIGELLASDIEEMEKELNQYRQSFNKCIKELVKYETIEKNLKTPSLKKLF